MLKHFRALVAHTWVQHGGHFEPHSSLYISRGSVAGNWYTVVLVGGGEVTLGESQCGSVFILGAQGLPFYVFLVLGGYDYACEK
ncbi:hypothetical protein SKAU_G00000040 [Synaphobranchus kaupii]|uniref:Uncharacterized protein n=1 Tax=Synaphobranchus kaupii TaxID=118154 RepID=A0A9Q1JA58_SYNKA|nr:hypothetical protein SKAU_G00000040 [Synaphobranchus kaupii]